MKLINYLPKITVKEAGKVLRNYTGRIADVGCGKGVLLDEIKGDGSKKVFGIDILWHQIIEAKAKGMPVVQGDILKMPFKNGAFDAEVCLNTMYNFPSLPVFEPALKEMIRVLKKNGGILIDIRNKKNPVIRFKCWLHMRKKTFPTVPYHPEEMDSMMKKIGCKLIDKSAVGINNPYLAWGYVMVFEKEGE